MSEIKKPRIFIREQLHEEIKSIVDNYFFTTYNKAKYPYAVTDIKEIGNEVLTQYSLDVSVYDKKEDTTELETVCDKLKEILDTKKGIKENYAYAIWFNTCLTDKEEDKTIKKRILSFEIHLFYFE
jgi:hypothetical protein